MISILLEFADNRFSRKTLLTEVCTCYPRATWGKRALSLRLEYLLAMFELKPFDLIYAQDE